MNQMWRYGPLAAICAVQLAVFLVSRRWYVHPFCGRLPERFSLEKAGKLKKIVAIVPFVAFMSWAGVTAEGEVRQHMALLSVGELAFLTLVVVAVRNVNLYGDMHMAARAARDDPGQPLQLRWLARMVEVYFKRHAAGYLTLRYRAASSRVEVCVGGQPRGSYCLSREVTLSDLIVELMEARNYTYWCNEVEAQQSLAARTDWNVELKSDGAAGYEISHAV